MAEKPGNLRTLRHTLALVLAASSLFWSWTLAPAEAQEAPSLLADFCTPTGSEAGQCNIPRGIGVDSITGRLFVGDQANRRINKFTAWGEFLRTWGWDVVLSGPGNKSTSPDPPQFEICVPADGDVCKAGVTGPGVGQITFPYGLAVDEVGDVYVVDRTNQRVQKFDSEGSFLLMFGGEVNKTTGANVCTKADLEGGDECGIGIKGSAPGFFGEWGRGDYIDLSPDGETIYVGDEARIQEFDTAGNYQGDLPNPEGLLTANTVQSLAVDPGSGDLYVSFANKGTVAGKANPPNVYRLDPVSGEQVDELAVGIPTGVAVDAQGEVYVFDDDAPGNTAEPGNHILRILRFDSEGGFKEVYDQNQSSSVKDRFTAASTGLATSSACGIEGSDLYVSSSTSSPSFVRAYGPPPQNLDPPCDEPPEVPPTIEDQFAVSVATDGATLRAEINPNFWPDSRYYVQYGTGKCSEGGCEEVEPLPPGLLLTDVVVRAPILSAGIFLAGLEPNTTYHYRFVAQSSGGGPVFGVGATEAEPQGQEGTLTTFPTPSAAKTDCPNQVFRTGLSAPLPDCRAYELVSPLDKDNGDIATDEARFAFDPANYQLASPDGNRATYSSFRSFGDPESAPLFTQLLSSRDPETGWSTHSISPPRTSVPFFPSLSLANTTQFKVFSDDLCSGWFIQDTDLALLPGAPPAVPNIYRRDDGDCGPQGYELITNEPPPGFSEATEPANSTYGPTVQGISADSSRTLLRADAVLSADACTTTPGTSESKGIFQVYLHDSEADALHLVSVRPNGSPSCVHSSGGTAQGPFGDTDEDSVHHALSADGSRAFWSASASTSKTVPPFNGGLGDQPGPLYLRVNIGEPQSAISAGDCTEAAKACTYEVSELVSDEPARFQTATPDGSRALFSLDPDGSDPEPTTLYEFVASPGPGGILETEAIPIAASFGGLMGASTDLSRVYLVSTAVLTPNPNPEGEEASGGGLNLYLFERGVGSAFVGRLASRDASNSTNHFALPSPIATLPDRRTSRVSPDGMHAAFTSVAPLTGHDNTDLVSGEPDSEVFFYDAVPGAGVGELACVSCNRSGSRPRGLNMRTEADPDWVVARIPGWQSQLDPTRALSEDGNRVFFESFEPLVLRDTNTKRDVYQWERAASAEECLKEKGADLHLEAAGGCLSLISSGRSGEDSDFFDASASGADVFFATASSLVSHDFGLMDVYDAREGGGFPPPTPPKPPCEGEACQPAPPPPVGESPASKTVKERGNVAPPKGRRPCPRGKRRVVRAGKVRCVKKKKGKRATKGNRRAEGRASR